VTTNVLRDAAPEPSSGGIAYWRRRAEEAEQRRSNMTTRTLRAEEERSEAKRKLGPVEHELLTLRAELRNEKTLAEQQAESIKDERDSVARLEKRLDELTQGRSRDENLEKRIDTDKTQETVTLLTRHAHNLAFELNREADYATNRPRAPELRRLAATALRVEELSKRLRRDP